MFRRQKAVKQLSAEELKSKLYAHFDKTGSLQQLRTQVRTQLMSELFKLTPQTENYDKIKSETVGLDKKLLPLQVCNWLVHDHLLRQSYQYTLSTFVSETNLSNPDKLLTAGDVLVLFGLNNSTQEFKKISELYSVSDGKRNFHSLLLAIIKSLLDLPFKDNLEYEKQTATEQYENDNRNLTGQNKEEIEDHNEVLKFKSHNQPNESIMGASFESSFNEQLQCVKEEKEKEIQKIRHKLLQELERLHLQERSMQLEFDQEKKELNKERDALCSDRQKLKEKEMLFIKEQENKLEKKVKEIEEVYAFKLHSKEREIENLQKRMLEKEQNIGQIEFELQSHRERFDALKQELEDMNLMYKSVHEKYNSLLDENTNLVKKFQSMSDYDVMKEEISIKSKEIQNLRQNIQEAQRIAEKDRKSYTETVANLELKLRSIEPQLHQTQRELNLTKDNLHLEEVVWKKEKQKLEQESITAKELYKTVLQRIEEQKQDIQDLHQTIHILHYQLTNKDLNSAMQSDAYNKKEFLKMDFLPKPSKSLKLNKNTPVNLSQHYRENALNVTADHKSRLHQLQQEGKANYDKYSLIYCSSLDDKVPKSDISHMGNLFSPSDNFKLSSFPTTKFPSTSNNYFSGFQNENLSSRAYSSLNFGRNDTLNFLKEKHSGSRFEAETYSPNFQNAKLLATYDEMNKKASLSSNQNFSPLVIQAELSSLKKPEKYNPTNEKAVSIQESEKIYQTKSPVPKEIYERNFSPKSTDIDIYCLKNNGSNKAAANQKIVEKNSTNLIELETSTVKIKSQHADCISDAESVLLVEKKTPSRDNVTFHKKDFKVLASTNKKEFSTSSSNKLNLELEIDDKQNEISKNGVCDSTLKNNRVIEPLNEFSSQKEDQAHAKSNQPEPRNTQETIAVVVDLDAAWKRKASLPSPPLLQTISHSKSLNPDSSNISLLASKKELNSKVSEIKSLDVLSNKTSESTNKVNSDKMDQVNIGSAVDESTISTFSTQSSIAVKQAYHSDSADQISKTLPLNDEKLLPVKPLEFQINVIQQDICDNNMKKENYIEDTSLRHCETKQLEDSLSELSEVHMSCGSEQEQQKEESDNNW